MSTSSGVGGTYSTSFVPMVTNYDSETGIITITLGASRSTNENRSMSTIITSFDLYAIN